MLITLPTLPALFRWSSQPLLQLKLNCDGTSIGKYERFPRFFGLQVEHSSASPHPPFLHIRDFSPRVLSTPEHQFFRTYLILPPHVLIPHSSWAQKLESVLVVIQQRHPTPSKIRPRVLQPYNIEVKQHRTKRPPPSVLLAVTKYEVSSTNSWGPLEFKAPCRLVSSRLVFVLPPSLAQAINRQSH